MSDSPRSAGSSPPSPARGRRSCWPARRRRSRTGVGIDAAGLRRAGGRRDRRGRRRQPAHRLRLRHRRDRRSATARRGGRAPGRRRSSRPSPTPASWSRRTRGTSRSPSSSTALTPGDHAKKSALFNSGAEAVENAVKIARAYTGRAGGRRVRPRLPRPHQPHDGADREEHALQGGLRPVRARGLPGAAGLPVPLATGAEHGGAGGRGAGDRHDQQAGRRAATSPPS